MNRCAAPEPGIQRLIKVPGPRVEHGVTNLYIRILVFAVSGFSGGGVFVFAYECRCDTLICMNTIKDVTGRDSGLRPDPMVIIEQYYSPGTKSYEYLVEHGRMVAEKALEIARKVFWLPPGMLFIEEAAMLHDIGIYMTDAPHLGCTGEYPYIAHGYIGRQILEEEGYPLHALVCERHVGVGLTAKEIVEKALPVPARNMVPITLEEEIICFADKLHPVTPEKMLTRISVAEAREDIKVYGPAQLRKFDRWAAMFQEA